MSPAAVVADDATALELASGFAWSLAEGAADRDAERRLPRAELDALSDSGLLALTVPREHGGADVSWTTVAEVFRLLAWGDPSVSQIPQSHIVYVDLVRRLATPQQQEVLFAEVLAGGRIANAQTERGTKVITEDRTTLTPSGDGYLLNGEKYYCTGALLAHRLAVRANLGDGKGVAYVPVDTPGVTVEDDWDGLGQRTTCSGTVRLVDVPVESAWVVPSSDLFAGPSTYGAQAQVLHAAIDVGIAGAALAAAAGAVDRARPYFEAQVDTAAEDPLTLQQAGEVWVTVAAAESLLRDAARAIDVANADPTDETTAAASVAVATAKVQAARAAVEASSVLFEIGGTRAASAALRLDRYWRDARTHTLHDPTRWKVQHLGRWALRGTPPPRHGLL